ncbi:hypothetical protein Ahia01_001029100 [Argonauta hians]
MGDNNFDNSTKKFTCQVCKFSANYQFFGAKPPKCESVILKEESYILKDHFSSSEEQSFIVLGSHCARCKVVVCVDSKCSFYYEKRFCSKCCLQYISEFPTEIQQEIRKKMKDIYET